MQQKIVPNLWFDLHAFEAAKLYASLFKDAKVVNVTYASKAGVRVSGLPEGTVMTVEFEAEGQRFIGINGGPVFKFTPAVSYLIACNSKDEVNGIWNKLFLDGGIPLMPLGEYPFSEWYGWLQDNYGVSWQVMHVGGNVVKQKITPTLMFVGKQCGRAEEAVNYYVSIFKESKVVDVLRYVKGEEPDREGTIKHVEFDLEKQRFAAMDSAHDHRFTFSEANSFMVECSTQQEIDYYWEKLSAGGEEGVCGWLKDRFGVSWQVTPKILREMIRSNDREKVERVTKAFLQMKKFEIDELVKAYGY